MAPHPVILYFRMQFIQIIPHAEQKNLQFYFCFPSKQKSLEFIIIFQDSKDSFYLDRAVHPISNPFFAQDIFIRFLTLFQKALRNIQPFVLLCFRTFFFIRTAGAIFTFMEFPLIGENFTYCPTRFRAFSPMIELSTPEIVGTTEYKSTA